MPLPLPPLCEERLSYKSTNLDLSSIKVGYKKIRVDCGVGREVSLTTLDATPLPLHTSQRVALAAAALRARFMRLQLRDEVAHGVTDVAVAEGAVAAATGCGAFVAARSCSGGCRCPAACRGCGRAGIHGRVIVDCALCALRGGAPTRTRPSRRMPTTRRRLCRRRAATA